MRTRLVNGHWKWFKVIPQFGAGRTKLCNEYIAFVSLCSCVHTRLFNVRLKLSKWVAQFGAGRNKLGNNYVTRFVYERAHQSVQHSFKAT